jgi:hypothetical protein
MRSYSNEVADTSKVEAVEQRLTEALSKQDEAQNTRIKELESEAKYLKLRANLQTVLVFLVITVDILRHGF